MSSSYYLGIKTSPTDWKHFKVPKEVYTYVIQLETYIRHPEESKLKEVYHERFGNGINSR